MGMFDTIRLSEALQVPGLPEPVTEIQTKKFGRLLLEYTIGSVLQDSPVLYGLVEESIWCPPQGDEEKGTNYPVYLVVWHNILAGVFLDAKEAEKRLHTVDRLDLIRWLDEAQRTTYLWKRLYWKFYADISEWHQRQNEKDSDLNP